MLHSRLLAVAALVVAHGALAQAPSTDLGRNVAATCANCHGTNGTSAGEVASLAGQPKEELVRKLQAFKAGTMPGTIMPQLAKGFTDGQIEAAAAWFASQKLGQK